MHGWRATARTLLHEVLGYAPEVIEHQLAHKASDRLGSAYNRTKFAEKRREMMDRWAAYLDALRDAGPWWCRSRASGRPSLSATVRQRTM